MLCFHVCQCVCLSLNGFSINFQMSGMEQGWLDCFTFFKLGAPEVCALGMLLVLQMHFGWKHRVLHCPSNRHFLVILEFVACSAPSHYLHQHWLLVNWTLWNKLQLNFNQNNTLFIHEKVFESVVCEMAAILSRGNELMVDMRFRCSNVIMQNSRSDVVAFRESTHWGRVTYICVGRLGHHWFR